MSLVLARRRRGVMSAIWSPIRRKADVRNNGLLLRENDHFAGRKSLL
jgi:hypothetical protein